MKTIFKPLIRLRFRHSFYRDGRSKKDFIVQPSPACEQLLYGYGLVFRRESDGFTVYAEVNAEGSGFKLVRSVSDDTLRFSFLLQSVNPYFLNVSDVTEHRPGRDIFYFNNLRDDQEDGRLYLGDSIAKARIGIPIRFVCSSIFNYRFDSPVNAASLVLKDLFGNELYRCSFRIPDPSQKVKEYQLDLSKINKLLPGRYEIADNHGGSDTFYYTPVQFGKNVFGIIEIFNRTDAMTLDRKDLVPAAYKFLSDDTLTNGKTYMVQFTHLETTWRYIVIKKYKSNKIELKDLKISADVKFNDILLDGQVIFESDVAVPLHEKRQKIELLNKDKKIRDLPNPTLKTPLKIKKTGSKRFESHMFIYV